MLNFLNLKSFPLYLFFVVASSLSILCYITPFQHLTFEETLIKALISQMFCHEFLTNHFGGIKVNLNADSLIHQY